ncbi:hypothetical protein [Hyphomonas sp.]|uniref:hypothetical protein n=1 Tax=Hyphomonas sp. TaxID=87 RepID=UPI003918B1FB
MPRTIIALCLLGFLGPSCADSSRDTLNSDSAEICLLNLFGASSPTECICKMRIAGEEFGSEKISVLLGKIDQNPEDKIDALMLEFALSDPDASKRSSERSRSECTAE